MGFGASGGRETRLGPDDLVLLADIARASEAGLPRVALLQLLRVYGHALAQVADAEVRLFHLYVHEPLMQDGASGERIAQEMEDLVRGVLPLAAPIMHRVHRRHLRRFVAQDVIGHMEDDDGDGRAGRARLPGRLRVAIAFADLAGYTRMTEELGDEEAVLAVERFIEEVERSLPSSARVVKEIGDEVMVVGSDVVALTAWSVAFQAGRAGRRPQSRIGLHVGEVLYRDGEYYGREVNLASRVAAARGRRRGARDARRRRGGGQRAGARAHRRGPPQGLHAGDRALPRLPTPMSDLLERVRRHEAAARRGAARRAAQRRARLRLPARRGGADHRPRGRSSRCTSTTACAATSPRATRRTAASWPRRSAPSSWSSAPARRRARGNLQAWARDHRLGAAAAVATTLGARVATGHTMSDQAETILYRLAASPGRRALLGMQARDGLLVRPLLEMSREETAAHCRARGLRVAGGLQQRRTRVHARARACGACCPRCASCIRPRSATSSAPRSCCARRPAVLDELVETVLDGRDHVGTQHLAVLPPALARLVVRRLAEDAAGRLCPRAPGRLRRADRAARRRARRGRGRPRGGLRREAAHGADAAARSHLTFGQMRDPAVGEILVQPDELARRVRELGAEISRDYEDREPLLIGVLKGAVFFLSDLMRSLDVSCEVDFMAVASYGSATESSGVVRILKDLDAAIEGRDVLIVEDIVDSGLTLQYLLRNLGARGPRSLEVCALLTKPERRRVELSPRYVGFEIPDRFVVGYGLDYAERYRNLPYVAVLDT